MSPRLLPDVLSQLSSLRSLARHWGYIGDSWRFGVLMGRLHLGDLERLVDLLAPRSSVEAVKVLQAQVALERATYREETGPIVLARWAELEALCRSERGKVELHIAVLELLLDEGEVAA